MPQNGAKAQANQSLSVKAAHVPVLPEISALSAVGRAIKALDIVISRTKTIKVMAVKEKWDKKSPIPKAIKASFSSKKKMISIPKIVSSANVAFI